MLKILKALLPVVTSILAYVIIHVSKDIKHLRFIIIICKIKNYIRNRQKGVSPQIFIIFYVLFLILSFMLLKSLFEVRAPTQLFFQLSISDTKWINIIALVVAPLVLLIISCIMSLFSLLNVLTSARRYMVCDYEKAPYINTNSERYYVIMPLTGGNYLCQIRYQIILFSPIFEVISSDNVINLHLYLYNGLFNKSKGQLRHWSIGFLMLSFLIVYILAGIIAII